jgi:hypothetical protein
MNKNKTGTNMEDYRQKCINLLKERGVTLNDIADAARFLQADYHVDLLKEECSIRF